MDSSATLRALFAASWLCVCLSSSGCIALGIPSERYHDPADSGGLLGDWKRGQPYDSAALTAELIEEGAVLVPSPEGLLCSGVSPLDMSAVDGCGREAKPKPPKVPWPRFHPVPTRPVFGSGL